MLTEPAVAGPRDLTPREHEVLELVASGLTDGQIAERLVISRKSASVHVSNIKAKLAADTRVGIALTAFAMGIGPLAAGR